MNVEGLFRIIYYLIFMTADIKNFKQEFNSFTIKIVRLLCKILKSRINPQTLNKMMEKIPRSGDAA